MPVSIDQQLLRKLEAEHGPEAVARQRALMERNADAVDDPALWLTTALQREFKEATTERVTRCPCGSTAIELLSRFVFWSLLGVSRCTRCGLIMTSPRLAAESLARVFDEHYFDPTAPELWGQRRRSVFEDVLRLIPRADTRRVLDIGTAYGHFVRWLQRQGLDAVGIDVSRHAVDWGREHLGVPLIHGSIASVHLPERSFDCAVSLDALYYSLDPRADLEALHRTLRPRGRLVLRMRTNAGVARRAVQEGRRAPIGRPLYPVEHLWAFTPSSAAALLDACGFDVLQVEPAAYSLAFGMDVQAPWLAIARAMRSIHPSVPITTRSFNVLARAR